MRQFGFSFAVVSLPKGGDWAEYYILQNGSDTSECGGSVASACASLQQVLNRYYAEPPTMGLQITTDISLFVDQSIMVSVMFE